MVASHDLAALALSFAFILAIVAAAFLLYRYAHLGAEVVRKLIHIGVSNWVFILVFCFSDPRVALAGPAAFIIINAVFVYSGAARFLGMGNRKRDNGLIYFPISLLILTLLNIRALIAPYDVIAGTLVMGYGDGLAALIGSRWGRHQYSVMNARKSWEGTLVMFFVSLAVVLIFTPYSLATALVMALVAAFFEAVTPLGLDNITVPLLTVLTGVVL